MSDQNQEQNQEDQVSELEMLKSRARMMGIEFSNNIGVDTLRKRVEDRLNGVEEQPAEEATNTQAPNAFEVGARKLDSEGAQDPSLLVPERQLTLNEYLQKEQMKLVRVRVTCMDPKKKDLQGEFFTVGNEHLGAVRKFVPFGEHTEEGYHIPFIIYTMMENRKFLSITSSRDRRTGTMQTKTTWAKEFAIEVLPPLTREEITQLATAQIAAGSVDA